MSKIPMFPNKFAILASILGASTVNVDQGVVDAIEASYQAVNQYELYQGSTAVGLEAGWFGFKRGTNKNSYALFIAGDQGLAVAKRDITTGWSFTRLIQ